MPKVTYTPGKGLIQSGGSGVSLSGDLTLAGAFVGTYDTIVDDGPISLTTLTTRITTDGAKAYTLAAGAEGQIKIIVMRADVGDAVVTPAGGLLSGATTITFNDVGDSVILVYAGTKWAVVSNVGCTIA